MIAPYRRDGKVSVFDLPDEWFTHTMGHYWPDDWDEKKPMNAVPVLAYVFALPKLPVGIEWFALEHQSGGLECNQLRMVAAVLEAEGDCQSKFDAVAQFFYHSFTDKSADAAPIGQVYATYPAIMSDLGFSCEHSKFTLEEALYPMDFNAANIDYFKNSRRFDGLKHTEPELFINPALRLFGYGPAGRETIAYLPGSVDARDDAVIFLLSVNSD